MKVYCTSRFISEFTDLEKKNNYASIFEDVCCYFQNKNIQELHITKDILRITPNVVSLNKYRIPNNSMGIGKRGSFRCICMCNIASDAVYIDYIYPKSGSDGSDNVTKDGIKLIIGNINSSIKQGQILIIDIEKRHILDGAGKVVFP